MIVRVLCKDPLVNNYGIKNMKRTNNKFRNNNNYNNQVYSLNYKFDSNSIAGKCSGTALDLIKRYNELAKDALNNNDYVSAEVFRQYAEHYRKIVTEINEKKNQNQKNNNQRKEGFPQENTVSNDNAGENTASEEEKTENNDIQTEDKTEDTVQAEKSPAKKAFKIIEITETSDNVEADNGNVSEEQPKPKRTYRKKVAIV